MDALQHFFLTIKENHISKYPITQYCIKNIVEFWIHIEMYNPLGMSQYQYSHLWSHH